MGTDEGREITMKEKIEQMGPYQELKNYFIRFYNTPDSDEAISAAYEWHRDALERDRKELAENIYVNLLADVTFDWMNPEKRRLNKEMLRGTIDRIAAGMAGEHK